MRLINDYYTKIKNQKNTKIFRNYLEKLNTLFDLAVCRCTGNKCECHKTMKIPSNLREFIQDQRNNRLLNISMFLDKNRESHFDADIEKISDMNSSLETFSDVEKHDNEVLSSISSSPNPVLPNRISYNNRLNISNFVIECDRYNISDRAAAALASSLLKDFNILNENGEIIVFDKNKIRREREKSRKQAIMEPLELENMISFSFDSKKNRILTATQTDDNVLHPRITIENDIAIVKEPDSIFLGYAVANDSEKSPNIAKAILDFFSEKKISLKNIIAIGCDGEPKNTGKYNGVLRQIELALERPLHRFVCLLHFNELPFRHLFEKIDGSVTTGPKSTTGKLARALINIDKPVCMKIKKY